MPRGTRHVDAGVLMTDRGQYVLERDGGGTWRLDAPWRARRLLGQRVRIEGIRIDFDVLSVTTIEKN